MRATWAIPALMREAAAEVMRRGLQLSADPKRHQRMLDAALVAEDDRVAA